jgi:hypothetical protein
VNELAIFSWFGYRLPLHERFELISGVGFSATSIWLGEEEELVLAEREDDMPPLAAKSGLTVDNAHAPFDRCNDLWSESEARRNDIKMGALRPCL